MTDAEGRFAFERVALAGTELQLEHPLLLFRTVELADHADLAHLELVEPLLCELQVDLTRDPGLADRIEVLDADGEPLESFGAGIMAGNDALFRDGLSEVLRVKESAATLILRKNGLEVLRRPLKLDPSERTVARP